jgi:long-chain fatty acid transport protein
LAFLACLAAHPAWPAGFAVTAQGAAASGKSTAFTAQADDPSAMYYNPAGITQLATAEVMIGTTAIMPSTSYSPSGGKSCG